MAAAASAASALIAFAPVRPQPQATRRAGDPRPSRPSVLLLLVEGARAVDGRRRRAG